MLLAIDVGNTNTKLGVYHGRQLVASWRLTSRRDQTADEYGVFTHTLLRGRGVDPAAITGVAISSTVPTVQPTLEEMALRYFGVRPLVVEPGAHVPVPMLVDYPGEVGPDRLAKIV
ncbi:MAG: type III pantothenate kinase, partial [Candidatus Rokuibacteriota bacterium]